MIDVDLVTFSHLFGKGRGGTDKPVVSWVTVDLRNSFVDVHAESEQYCSGIDLGQCAMIFVPQPSQE